MPKKKILICDDELGIRESLKLILENDYELSFCSSGDECLACAKDSGNVDLVLLDIKMPQLNGMEVLKQIKEASPDTKIIMVTGYKSVETATEAVKAGAVDYIVKPFESKDILGKVSAALSK